MTCAIQRPACLLIARLAAVTSLKISGKVTLRGKRRLTANSVHMGSAFLPGSLPPNLFYGSGKLSVTTWKCVGISRGMILYTLFDYH